ncbi:DUF1127 domain-containing protein [Salibaculum griseiflavum]|uniref:DUF1127 domain-containing protein n=1 Tax=Salibaculum griseiflavum TaxID=1914409 RepID=A0A2V1NZW5_9RHOB|nr:hypothetical protein [Salibaculum griseiflavum]PWG15861.1 hypothetical protein DFK10_14495 [Salibaculum griseiflavum]
MATLTATSSRPLTAPRGPGQSLAKIFAVWRQRRDLAALDRSRLSDLGLTEAQALRESARPAWDLPR